MTPLVRTGQPGASSGRCTHVGCTPSAGDGKDPNGRVACGDGGGVLSYRQGQRLRSLLPRERRRTWHPPPLPGTAAHPTFPACGPSSRPPTSSRTASSPSATCSAGRAAAPRTPWTGRWSPARATSSRPVCGRRPIGPRSRRVRCSPSPRCSAATPSATARSPPASGWTRPRTPGRRAVPPPAEPLPLAAADAPVRQVMAALQSAGTPVRAVLVDGPIGTGLPGSGTVSGAGIVAAALGAPPSDKGAPRGPDRRRAATTRPTAAARTTEPRLGATAARAGATRAATPAATPTGTTAAPGRTTVAPSRPVVPLPSANPDLPPPVTGSDIVDRSLGGSGSAPDGVRRRRLGRRLRRRHRGRLRQPSVRRRRGHRRQPRHRPMARSRTPARTTRTSDDARRQLLGRHRVGRRNVLGRQLLRTAALPMAAPRR